MKEQSFLKCEAIGFYLKFERRITEVLIVVLVGLLGMGSLVLLVLRAGFLETGGKFVLWGRL